ncbi:hypothetical protein LCGC14_2848100 [marine sediment metagenome]|uniref:Uncharacterized protein n=1 Tax=marine sediment metagenome TaxID=412755 RepID=A0A0F9AHL7_9ZZZZ
MRPYRTSDKTLRIVRSTREPSRYIGSLSEPKYTKSIRCTKKTAILLLERDDDNQGMLTAVQRETLEARAGEQYRKRDPFDKRPSETTAGYVARIRRVMKG